MKKYDYSNLENIENRKYHDIKIIGGYEKSSVNYGVWFLVWRKR